MSEVAQLDAELVLGDWDDLEDVSRKVDQQVRFNRVNLFGCENPLLAVLRII